MTVEPVGTGTPDVEVELLARQVSGGCTAIAEDGSVVTMPASGWIPITYPIIFDTSLATQDVGTQGLGWYFQITKLP